MTSVMLAMAKPWTYWLAPSLLVVNVLAILVVAIGYYRKVVVPAYEWKVHQAAEQLAVALSPANVAELRPRRPASEPMAA